MTEELHLETSGWRDSSLVPPLQQVSGVLISHLIHVAVCRSVARYLPTYLLYLVCHGNGGVFC